MKNRIKNILNLSVLIGLLASSCVNDSFTEPVEKCAESTLVKTKEVQDIYNMATVTGTKYTADDIIEAIVTSSDEGGNFFKTVSFISLDGNRGFSISIDDNNLYTQNLQPGKKVFIKLKDLYIMRPSGGAGGLVLGGAPAGSFGTLQRIPATEYKNFIIPSCTVYNEEDFVKKLTSLSQLNNDNYLNSLVEIDNVQFENTDVTYANKPTDASDKNENINDGTASFVTRTSKFSNFAGSIVPLGRGKIRAVLTKFNSTYQLVIRNERDVNLTKPRVDFTPAIVGNALTFDATLNELFTSYAVNQTNFPKYINDAFVNSRYWQLKQFPTGTGNKYIEMSSFNGTNNPGVVAQAYFFVPVNFTTANTFTFKEEIRFNQGQVLKVYYVSESDYTAGDAIDITKFVNITPNFSITYPAIGQSENAFNSAGTYNIPATLTGNGYFVFEYSGNTTVTTTVQIDDIVIN